MERRTLASASAHFWTLSSSFMSLLMLETCFWMSWTRLWICPMKTGTTIRVSTEQPYSREVAGQPTQQMR